MVVARRHPLAAPLLGGIALTGVLAGSFAPGTALAQNIPQSIQPGRVPQQLPAPAPLPTAPQLELSAPAEAPPPEVARKIRFRLADVEVTGVTVYPAGMFQSLYAPSRGQEITLADIYDWANKITSRYRADGYILSQAVVPAQRIHGGVIRIVVIEGFIDKVAVQGASSARLEEYGQHLTGERPLKAKDLERFLLLANDLPGMTVRSVLKASPNVLGAADLTLIAKRKTVDASIGIDNFGSRYQGPWEGTGVVGFNGVLGHDERVALRYSTVSSVHELKLFGATVSLPIDSNGLSLVVDASHSLGHPGYNLARLDPRTVGNTVSVAVQKAVIRSRSTNLIAAATFSYLDSTTVLHPPGPAIAPSSDDKVRALRLSANFQNIDTHGGQNSASAEFSQGIPIFDSSRFGQINSSRMCGRTGCGEPAFSKLVVSLSRLQSLGGNYAVLVGTMAQTAFGESLLASEQFGLGGATFLRGYDPSELTGDNGIAGKLELQKNILFHIGKAPAGAQLFAFYDIGTVTTRDYHLTSADGVPISQATLASTGAGVRFNLGHGVLPVIELAKPLTRPVAASYGNETDPKDLRIYFSLTASF